MSRVLVTRYGGIGDMMPLTVVCRELKARGLADHLTFAAREEVASVMEHLPQIDAVLPLRRINGLDCVPHGTGWTPWGATTQQYTQVYDYINTVENNPFADHGNWYDLALAFAKIDPNSVIDKSPSYTVTQAERAQARARFVEWGWCAVDRPDPAIVTCILGGSSRLRQWDQWPAFVAAVHARWPEAKVLCLGDERHKALLPEAADWCRAEVASLPVREAVAVLAESTAAVGTDSGFLHLAEACAVPMVGLFTTVKAWTRSQYYRHVVSLDETSGCPKAPCCALDTWCPAAMGAMTDDPARWTGKHAVLWQKAYRENVGPDVLVQSSGMHPVQFREEWNYMLRSHERFLVPMPVCVQSHTVPRVLEALAALPVDLESGVTV